jgi:ABC-type uncharacterized transport system permease subunit
MTLAAHDAAALLYLGAALLAWASGASRARARAAVGLVALAVVAHAVAFVGFHLLDPPVPLSSFPAALSLIAWLTASAWLLSLGLAAVQSIGALVAAFAFALTAAGSLGLHTGAPTPAVPGAIGWSHSHVLFAAAGFGLLALSSFSAAAYLAKDRALKAKRPTLLPLPSLESLDRVGGISLAIGYPLLTLGVVTGIMWARENPGEILTAHAVLALVAWTVYLLPVAQRLRSRQGQASARALVLGFAVLLCAYLGARSLGTVP